MTFWALAFLAEGILLAVNTGGGLAETAQSDWEPVLFAVFGSLAINALNLLEGLRLRRVAPDRSPDIKDPVYWVTFFVMPVLAAGLALAYVRGSQPLTPLVAINVGASAPAILRALASAISLPTAPTPSQPGGGSRVPKSTKS